MSNRSVYIVWSRIFRRPQSMQEYFGYEIQLFPLSYRFRILRPLEYVQKMVVSLAFLLQLKPSSLWIHCAPTLTLYYAHFYKLLFPQVSIVVDCHNSAFRSPWISLPGVKSLYNASTAVLVHNEEVRDRAISLGLKKEKVFVLEDKSPNFTSIAKKDIARDERRPYVLFACSFDQDEPLEVVFSVAKQLPHISFVISGDYTRAVGLHNIANPPHNVKLTGFLSLCDYNNVLINASVALCLTTREGVQLCVANEAVGAGIPMVMSNTKILRQLFNRGSLFVDTFSAASISTGIKEVLEKRETLASEVIKLRQEREYRWFEQAKNVINAIDKIK